MTGFCLSLPAYFYTEKSMVLRTQSFMYNYGNTIQISLKETLPQSLQKDSCRFCGEKMGVGEN